MSIEKKDWENIKKEAETQIKQASIVIAVNSHVKEQAENEIKRIDYAESSKQKDNTATLK